MEQHQAAVVRSSPAAGCCWESLAPAARVSGASQKPVTVEYIDQRASHCRVSQPDQVTSPGCTGKPNNMCWGDKSASSREEKQEISWWKVEVALNLSLQKLLKESCLLYFCPLDIFKFVRSERRNRKVTNLRNTKVASALGWSSPPRAGLEAGESEQLQIPAQL